MKEAAEQLEALAGKIQAEMNATGRYRVNEPAELKIMREAGYAQLHEFARRHGWILVRHLDDDLIEFFKALPGQFF